MGRARAIFFVFPLLMITACRGDPRVVIATRSAKEAGFEVEVADTPAKREMGLMYRRDLPADHGMLFIFPEESVLTFWMKNTPIPLDMIFIGSDLKIVGIVPEAAPFTLSARSVGKPSRYVLEINGGVARERGIGVGDTVRFEGVSAEAVKE